MIEYASAKTGESAPFAKKKNMKNDLHNSLHLERKNSQIFVLHDLLEAYRFLLAMLLENLSLLGRDNIRACFRDKWWLLFMYATMDG